MRSPEARKNLFQLNYQHLLRHKSHQDVSCDITLSSLFPSSNKPSIIARIVSKPSEKNPEKEKNKQKKITNSELKSIFEKIRKKLLTENTPRSIQLIEPMPMKCNPESPSFDKNKLKNFIGEHCVKVTHPKVPMPDT